MTLNNFILLILLSTFSYNATGQVKAPRLFSEQKMMLEIDTLRNAYSKNKFLYEKYELQTLIALSYYPELINTKISFRRKELKTTMVARPKGIEIFRKRGKRHYIIYINDFPSANVPTDSVSFNGQIGVIAHELAHIAEYESISSLKIMYIGMAYFNKKFKTKFEKATDQRTIDHGLMWQCYDFAVFVHSYKYITPKYLAYKKRFYMSPEEIKKQTKKRI